MNHDHNQQDTCQYCKPDKSRLLSFLGVCGCVSCYFAMFPAIFLSIVGVLGLSTSATAGALNAYMNSILFQPILIFSILFLIIGLIRYGSISLLLSIVSGVGIFVSMNFYMRSWLFTLSFALLALAYFLAYRKSTHSTGSGLMVSKVEPSKSVQLKIALIVILAVVILGIIDIGKTAFSSSNQQMPPSMMQMQ